MMQFLSGLCGRELKENKELNVIVFLSGLCGRERGGCDGRGGCGFLSGLCGREQWILQQRATDSKGKRQKPCFYLVKNIIS